MKYLAISDRVKTNLVLILAAMLIVATFTISVSAEEAEVFSLVVTDGGTGFLGWAESVSAFPFDSVNNEIAGEPAGVSNSPLSPVEFQLPEGGYQIVVSILGFRVGDNSEELFLIKFTPMGLSEDILFDLTEAEITNSSELPRFIPSATLSKVNSNEGEGELK